MRCRTDTEDSSSGSLKIHAVKRSAATVHNNSTLTTPRPRRKNTDMLPVWESDSTPLSRLGAHYIIAPRASSGMLRNEVVRHRRGLTKLLLVAPRLKEQDRGSRFREVDQGPGEDAQGQDAKSGDVEGHLGHVCRRHSLLRLRLLHVHDPDDLDVVVR